MVVLIASFLRHWHTDLTCYQIHCLDQVQSKSAFQPVGPGGRANDFVANLLPNMLVERSAYLAYHPHTGLHPPEHPRQSALRIWRPRCHLNSEQLRTTLNYGIRCIRVSCQICQL